MTLVDKPVLQPRMGFEIATVDDAKVGLTAFGNIDLHNNLGDSWFPDGHAGRFSEIDFIADYTWDWGPVTLRQGIHSYNLPNGLEFPNGERGGTNEVFVLAQTEVLEATPYASFHYDFDEVHGSYFRGGISESFDLGEGFGLVLDGSLGYVASAQASWMYGLDEHGFADLRGSAIVSWVYDPRTTLEFGLHGSSIVDSTLDDWFSDLGIDSDPWWVSLGVTWSL
jgi:hypothetical protein